MPAWSSIDPGEPSPTPSSADGAIFAASAAASTVSHIAVTTSGGPPSVGVGRRAWPITVLASSMTIAWIFVPPRSMPALSPMGVFVSGRGRSCMDPAPI